MVTSCFEILKSEEFSRKSEFWKSLHSFKPHPSCIFQHSYQQCISSILFMFCFLMWMYIVVLNASVICRDVFLSWQTSSFQFCKQLCYYFSSSFCLYKFTYFSKAGLTVVVLFKQTKIQTATLSPECGGTLDLAFVFMAFHVSFLSLWSRKQKPDKHVSWAAPSWKQSDKPYSSLIGSSPVTQVYLESPLSQRSCCVLGTMKGFDVLMRAWTINGITGQQRSSVDANLKGY